MATPTGKTAFLNFARHQAVQLAGCLVMQSLSLPAYSQVHKAKFLTVGLVIPLYIIANNYHII